MARIRRRDSVDANFRRLLPGLLRRYFRKGGALAGAEASNDKLHRFRIRTKRIRYVAELYGEVFQQELGRALEEFREIQQALGALQDQTMVAAYFQGRLRELRSPAFQDEYRRVLDRSLKRQQTLRTAFFRRWQRLERSGFAQRLLGRIQGR